MPSGGEANDVAIKTARRATGRRRVVGLAAGYHGRTGLAGQPATTPPPATSCPTQPDFAKVPFGDLDAMARRSRATTSPPSPRDRPRDLRIPGAAGGLPPAVRALCDEHGTLLIADEVQTGLGRTGRLWGVERFGVQPDVLVTAKGLSGGMYPIAATVISERVAGWLHEYGWGHVSTFGGAEIGCRVAQKVLEITTRPETQSRSVAT